MNLAIYDDGLIDAAIGRTKNLNMGLTALQVSGAMPRLFFETGTNERCSRT
jgi:hypothetical protein